MTVVAEDDYPLPSQPESIPDIEKFTPIERNPDDKELDIENCVGALEDDSQWEVTWHNGDLDPDNPRSKHNFQKWLVTFIVSLASLNVTCTSSIYTSAYGPIMREWPGTPPLLAASGLSLYIAGLGFGPMLLGPLSEFFGRRPIFVVSFSAFTALLLPCALAPSIAVLLVFRFLTGFAGSAFLCVAGGTVGDMWAGQELSAPMMIYTASPFVGPTLGPMVGGFINGSGRVSWRWTLWVIIIWSGVMLASLFFLVPETYHPVLLRNRARKLREGKGGDPRWWARLERMDRSVTETIVKSCAWPWLLLVWEPMVLLLCIFTAVLLGVVYLFFEAFPLVFIDLHGMTLEQTGLTFLGLFVGMSLGVLTDPWWKRYYNYQVTVLGRKLIPELRLPPAVAGSVLVPIGLFWFGFASTASVHWIVPIIGSMFFAVGTLLAYSGVFTFLVEAYPENAASALAANSLLRCSFAAGFPLFGGKLYEGVGPQWGGVTLAFVTVALGPFPYLFYRYGEKIRKHSRYARSP
ncbi:MFS general substrate transporter [Terfezia boudieri ATCC MYA-4762]|uniref:MFS general substrate transporter n=1 Tax=Terfezia boudieri ATCC MYA-4762 TaxID=1051890 RepID=A0A3N4LDE1_9PEZI|nr:MFS general substrate transporter [Terfezia boudieri ATCC MYA-4762]